MIAKLSVVCQKQSNDSYFAICPELKECYTQGDTYEDALENLRELVLDTLKQEKDELVLNGIAEDKTYIFSEMVVEV